MRAVHWLWERHRGLAPASEKAREQRPVADDRPCLWSFLALVGSSSAVGMARCTWILMCLVPVVIGKTIQFYIEPAQRVVPTYVQQLVEGKMDRIDQGVKQTASVSLVYDSGYYIVVDTPSATDVTSKEMMLRGISSRNIVPGEVQLVVTTHGHPDHFGQGNFFPNARHFFGSYEYADDVFISTELSKNETMKISNNVEIWNTPGHTSQDISVIVHNVPCCGTVAVVGDLFYNEEDAINGTIWFTEAWNPLVGKLNRDKMICYADYIIPGHGKLFKISDEMKKNASCGIPLPSNEIDDDLTEIPTTTTLSPPTAESIYPTLATVPSTEMTSLSTELPTPPPESATPFFITVDMLPELETASPDLAELMRNVNGALPDIMNQVNNVVVPASQRFAEHKDLIQKINGSAIAPVVESAAMQLSRLLNMPNQPTVAKTESYPYMTYWQNTLKKIANDVPPLQHVFSSFAHKNSIHRNQQRPPAIQLPPASPSSSIISIFQRLINPAKYQSMQAGAPR